MASVGATNHTLAIEKLHYVVTNHAGPPRELCTEDGDIVWRGEQGSWYRHTQTLRNNVKQLFEDADNDPEHCDLRSQGQIENRGSGLYYNLNRYYDADSGQFLSSDPIGMVGGLRPQAYVHNPMEWVDPLGLMPLVNPLRLGHHIVPHAVATHFEIKPFNSVKGVPSMYWTTEQWDNIDKMGHSAMHGYNGLGTQTKPFVKKIDGEKADLNSEQWMRSLEKHYNNPEIQHVRGDLHEIGSNGKKRKLIAKNVTPAEAWKNL